MGMSKQAGVASGKLAELSERLSNNEFDLVAVGRALLQDPEWVVKVREGRLDDLEDFSKVVVDKTGLRELPVPF